MSSGLFVLRMSPTDPLVYSIVVLIFACPGLQRHAAAKTTFLVAELEAGTGQGGYTESGWAIQSSPAHAPKSPVPARSSPGSTRVAK